MEHSLYIKMNYNAQHLSSRDSHTTPVNGKRLHTHTVTHTVTHTHTQSIAMGCRHSEKTFLFF